MAASEQLTGTFIGGSGQMEAELEQTVGTFVVGDGATAREYEVVVRKRQLQTDSTARFETTSPVEFSVPVNLTMDSETLEAVKQISTKFKVPRYLGLERVLNMIMNGDQDAFVGFLNSGAYVEPRRIGGQQGHFRLSPGTNDLFERLSWECVSGNKSKLARSAFAYINRAL
jgi:hypothetical protein